MWSIQQLASMNDFFMKIAMLDVFSRVGNESAICFAVAILSQPTAKNVNVLIRSKQILTCVRTGGGAAVVAAVWWARDCDVRVLHPITG